MSRTIHDTARRGLLAAALVVAATACAPPETAPARVPCTPAPKAEREAGPLPFLEDDFTRARAEAQASGKLLLVDGWAPWCHTCLSMRAEVLSRSELGPMRAKYVGVALDTDREENADFVGRFPLKAWPTFFVLDPTDLRILELHAGSLSLAEMQRFLEAGLAARAPAGVDAERARALADAHAAFSARDLARAATLYEQAANAPWARRDEALLGAMRSLDAAKLDDRCRTFGMAHLGDVGGASPPSDFVYYLRDCASRADAAEKRWVFDATLSRLRALAHDPPEGASVDDRQDALDMLSEAEGEAGHPDLARRAQEARLALLEAAAQSATSPEEARVFDYARMGAYLALDRGAEAVAMLEQRCRELPQSYESFARLASTLHALHRERDALTSVNRAIALSYGPRRLRYLALRADIELALGDRDAQIATLEDEVKANESLRPGLADADRLADAKRRLAAAVAARDATRPDTSRKTPSR